MKSFCIICDNKGWVCENHPRQPAAMFSESLDACDCGAAEPCKFCNTNQPDIEPDMSRTGFRTIFDKDGWKG